MKPELDIRPSSIAGQWYPANPKRLAEEVDAYLQAGAAGMLSGEVVAVMAPHAGHRYSGAVAGYAFAAWQKPAPELVVVVSPMHYPVLEPLLTSAHQAYETPLGVIEIDQAALAALEQNLLARSAPRIARIARDPEHSLEIELPFLQRALQPGFRLLPVMVRDQGPRVAQLLGEALADTVRDRRALLVASTDLSHFYPVEVAARLDREILRRVEAFDPAAVIAANEQGQGYACGCGALAAVMWAAKALGCTRAQVLNYATSGDITGDYERVVGYAAAVFTRN